MTRTPVRSLLLLAVALLAHGALAATWLKPGDRVVIYGDSITEQRLYSRFMQQYIDVRYPDLGVRFYNAGWSGDRAPGGLNRLERDVLVLNPTVVTLFFGMNDGGYAAVNDNTVRTFRNGTEGIIKALQAKGVKVVVFTPGCVDPDRQAKLKDCNYNGTLEALGTAALELAKQYNCVGVDVFHPMLEYQNAHKAANPGYTMIPDSVHPDTNGHLVMARIMLNAFDVEPMPALGSFDLETDTGEGLHIAANDAEKIVLQTAEPAPVPFWFETGSTQTMIDSGFLALAGQKLTITGLPGARYELQVDGQRAGRFTAAALAAGINLPGTASARGKLLADMVRSKEDSYFGAWRQIRLNVGTTLPAAAQKIVDGLMVVDEAYHTTIFDLAKPVAKSTITLLPLPEGGNLAEGKPYVSSDPNKFNWGIGGLTDGSWQTKTPDCFATNDTDAFPKDVTIDLGQATAIASVILGVPNFGSTRTIKVAVSADGKTFTEVGSHEFAFKQTARFTYTFPTVQARFVRLIYADRYNEQAGYPLGFAFTTECEVYPPSKPAGG